MTNQIASISGKADRAGRLSADDWSAAALQQIGEQGVPALAVEPLARRLGVTKMAVSRWESGAAMPTADKLPTIAALLECEVNDLYDDETLRAASEAARAAVAAKGVADARALAAGK